MEMIKEEMLSYSNLTIEFPTKVIEIKKLKIIEEFNEHGIAKVELLAISKDDDRFIDDITPKTNIKIAYKKGEEEEITPVFIGVMTKIDAKKVDKFFDVTIELKSKSFLMDLKLKDRSFQYFDMTYADLFKKVIEDYPSAVIYDNASNGKIIEVPIIQYRETDYEFLSRLASRLFTGLINNVKSDNQSISIGKFKGDSYIEDTLFYRITRENGEFLKFKLNYGNLINEEDKIYYKIKSLRNFEILDTVMYEELTFKVYKKETDLENGLVIFTYYLKKETGLIVIPMVNHKIHGASIDGKVIEVGVDRVKLHLSIDKSQNVSEAYYYKCETPYSSEGSTGFYTMPQVGDSVKLYFPNEYMENAYVKTMNRLDGSTNTKFKDPTVKYYGNVEGKEIMLSRNEFQVTSKNGLILINMDVGSGIEITSSDDIHISTTNEAKIEGKKIEIRSGKEIQFSTKASSIFMDENINIKAETEVKVIEA
jgi:hypothetical protein